MKRLVLTTASILALTFGAAALAQTGTNAGPGTRATESPTNTGTNQTNMGTYPTGPGRAQPSTDCGPGSRASNDSGSGNSKSGSGMAGDCGTAGSSTGPGNSDSSEKR